MGCGASKAAVEAPVAAAVREEKQSAAAAKPETPPLSSTHTLHKAAGAVVAVAKDQYEKHKEVIADGVTTLVDKAKDLFTEGDFPALDLGISALEEVLQCLPAIKDTITTVANLVIPPPGGQVLGAIIQMGALLIADRQNKRDLHALARKCSELMRHVADPQTVRALETRENTSRALGDLKSVVYNCHAYIKECLEDKWAIQRVLEWSTTKARLQRLTQELEAVRTTLHFASDLAVSEVVILAEQEAEAAKAKLQGLLDKHGCKTTAELAAKPQAMAEALQVFAAHGSADTQMTVGALSTVLTRLHEMGTSGPTNLIKNSTVKELWHKHFPQQDNIKWDSFWLMFPAHVPEENVKAQLAAHLASDHHKEVFRNEVEREDRATVSVTEINMVFSEDGHEELVTKVTTIITQHKEGRAINNIHPLPPSIVPRPCEQDVRHLVNSNRVVIVQGWPGEGKTTTVLQAGLALYDGREVDSTYVGSFRDVAKEEDVDAALCEALNVIPKNGPKSEQLNARLAQLCILEPPPGSSRPHHSLLLILRHVDQVKDELQRYLVSRLRDCLEKVPGLKIVMCLGRHGKIHEHAHSLLAPVGSVATHELKPLDEATAAALLRSTLAAAVRDAETEAGSPDKSGEEKEAAQQLASRLRELSGALSEGDAKLLADNQGRNPWMIRALVGNLRTILEDPSFTIAEVLADARTSKVDLSGSGDEGSSGHAKKVYDMLMATLSRLEPELLLAFLILSDTLPANFDSGTAAQVLSIKRPADAPVLLKKPTDAPKLLKRLVASSVATAVGTQKYNLVPTCRDFAVSLLEAIPVDVPKVAEQARNAKAMLEDARRVVLDVLARDITKMYSAYCSGPASAYAELAKCWVPLQRALMWVAEDPALVTEAQRPAFLDMLLLCTLTKPLYNTALMQDVTARLAGSLPGDPVSEGLSRAVRASFWTLGAQSSDEARGIDASISQADAGATLLRASADSDPRAAWGLSVALLAKALLLRDKFELAPAIAAHQEALKLLESWVGEGALGAKQAGAYDNKLLVQRVLHLGELTGALDYAGQKEEGCQKGEEAVNKARRVFVNDHPITAMCLGALGYNLRNSKRLSEALETHKEAYTMRANTLGEAHGETAMSLNQLSLTRLDMAVHELSRPRGASLKMKDSGSQTSGTQQQVDPVWRYAKELLLEAEADALRSSQIRETCFGRNHPMVANAQEALSLVRYALVRRMYMDDKREGAIAALQETLLIRRACNIMKANKIDKLRDLLVELLAEAGREGEARRVEAEYATTK